MFNNIFNILAAENELYSARKYCIKKQTISYDLFNKIIFPPIHQETHLGRELKQERAVYLLFDFACKLIKVGHTHNAYNRYYSNNNPNTDLPAISVIKCIYTNTFTESALLELLLINLLKPSHNKQLTYFKKYNDNVVWADMYAKIPQEYLKIEKSLFPRRYFCWTA